MWVFLQGLSRHRQEATGHQLCEVTGRAVWIFVMWAPPSGALFSFVPETTYPSRYLVSLSEDRFRSYRHFLSFWVRMQATCLCPTCGTRLLGPKVLCSFFATSSLAVSLCVPGFMEVVCDIQEEKMGHLYK